MEKRYLGIMPYDEANSFEFVGRSEETWALYDRIVRNDYTVYYAASGEGKSSLIRAGLIPILRRRDFFPVYIVFEDKEFATTFSKGDKYQDAREEKIQSSIAEVIEKRIKIEEVKHGLSYEQSKWSKSHFTEEQSEVLKNNLWWKLRNYCFKSNEVELKPLFIFDQFEEVFTKASYEWTDAFFTWLEEISTDYVPDALREQTSSWRMEIPTHKNFKALFSFRTEYLGDLDYWCVQKHFLPSLQENRMCLKPLTIKGAKEVVSLNKSLESFADRIIQGCAESRSYTGNENQPCVYALILSVVCQTLSDKSEIEREVLLNNLNNNQDETIDDILLIFYKKKLKLAGLDYLKDEKIIESIESAFVDENGKRRRRDLNEPSVQPIAKWIERLSQGNNGLIKIIGKKENGNAVVNTVELPHDRLCKAIDSSRKERQGKIAWKLNRQGEWMQFGIIVAIVGVVAFLWNVLMPAIKLVIHAVLSNEPKNVAKDFWGYLQGNAVTYFDESLTLNAGFSTILLMILLVILLPLMATFVVRNDKRWQIQSIILSVLGTISFGILSYRNIGIEFPNSYVKILSVICLLLSIVVFAVSSFKLKSLKNFGLAMSQKQNPSLWPLWGGYFIFASYGFYEFLFRITFGISEPEDSSWAIVVLPFLYIFWGWGFFNMKVEKKAKLSIYLIVAVSILLILSIISYIPFYNPFKQSYGFWLSIFLVLLWIVVSVIMLWKTKSRSKYYVLSNSKRVLAAILGIIVMITTFFFNLGYNPYYINPSSVCHVNSWRDVIVYKNDSLNKKKFGIVYSTNGDTIISCCISDSVRIDSLLTKGKYPFRDGQVPVNSLFGGSLFEKDTVNYDRSLAWNSKNRLLTAYIPTVPTLEQYLHWTINRGHPKDTILADSVDYYAARLFRELRDANVDYALNLKQYNLDKLESLDMLCSLQDKALYRELEILKDTIDFAPLGVGSIERNRIEVLEDKDFVGLFRELSRYMLLCLIRDRINQSDMPAMFSLARVYIMVFFVDVPKMNMCISVSSTCTLNIDIEEGNKKETKNASWQVVRDIYSNDILNKKFFAWYDLFCYLCYCDIKYNIWNFGKNIEPVCEEAKKVPLENLLWNCIPQKYAGVYEVLRKNDDWSCIRASFYAIMVNNMSEVERKDFLNLFGDYMEQVSYVNNLLAVDASFLRLKEGFLDKAMPIMRSPNYRNCVYNNALETICQNLILISAIRCNDISSDITKFSTYFREKNNAYDQIMSVINLKEVMVTKKSNIMDAYKKLYEAIEEVDKKE